MSDEEISKAEELAKAWIANFKARQTQLENPAAAGFLVAALNPATYLRVISRNRYSPVIFLMAG